MAADLFDIAAAQLEHHAGLDRLAARGTLRLALKESGLDAKCLTLQQLGVVFEKVMPKELKLRGVSDAAAACSAVVDHLANSPATADAEPASDPEAIFRRLGKD
jgi:hypothetical protein